MMLKCCFSACCAPEPKPFSDLLREDPRPSLLHGGPLPRGHEDLDGCHSDGRRGLHAVPELRDRRVTGLEGHGSRAGAQPGV